MIISLYCFKDIITKMYIVFNIIFLCFTVFANESTNCDCDTFQIYYEEDESIYRNFTKQTAEIKGRSVYYSSADDRMLDKAFRDIIWWNDQKNSWMGNQGKLKLLKSKFRVHPFPTFI